MISLTCLSSHRPHSTWETLFPSRVFFWPDLNPDSSAGEKAQLYNMDNKVLKGFTSSKMSYESIAC